VNGLLNRRCEINTRTIGANRPISLVRRRRFHFSDDFSHLRFQIVDLFCHGLKAALFCDVRLFDKSNIRYFYTFVIEVLEEQRVMVEGIQVDHAMLITPIHVHFFHVGLEKTGRCYDSFP